MVRSLAVTCRNGVCFIATCIAFLLPAVAAQHTNDTKPNDQRTLSVGIVIFPGFQPLDVYGPLELFFSLSYAHKMTLSVIAAEAGPVSSTPPPHVMMPGMPPMDLGYMMQPAFMASHSFRNAPALDVLLVPGGLGNVAMAQNNNTSVEEFVARRYPKLQYLLSVCTGSWTLAKAGVLDGRRATTNKAGWDMVSRSGKNVTWVPTARWVQDGNIWTSSGVSAGLDMTYAFLAHLYGKEDKALIDMMNLIEYAPHTDPHWDPFSVVHKVPGADLNANVTGCVTPVGF